METTEESRSVDRWPPPSSNSEAETVIPNLFGFSNPQRAIRAKVGKGRVY